MSIGTRNTFLFEPLNIGTPRLPLYCSLVPLSIHGYPNEERLSKTLHVFTPEHLQPFTASRDLPVQQNSARRADMYGDSYPIERSMRSHLIGKDRGTYGLGQLRLVTFHVYR